MKPLYQKSVTDAWKEYIPNIDEALTEVSKKNIVFLGVVPYSRITLGLFLNNFTIYCAKYAKDIALMRQLMNVQCVEERFPKIVDKIQGTGYLLQNFSFQNFLKSRKSTYTVLFYMITEHIYKGIVKYNLPFIGNTPDKRKDVLVKASFRKIIKALNLPSLPDVQMPRQDFTTADYNELVKKFNGSFVCQRGDLDVGGQIATFFIHTESDFKHVQKVFTNDTNFSIVQISQYVRGNTYSMVGCATKQGTVCGPLQTQLIDIPESVRDYTGRGTFVGHDWGLRDWAPGTEETAVAIVKTFGDYLYKQGYKGIFGIDFIYDQAQEKIYPLECNPRFTGSFPMVSLLAMANGLPPFDLLHVLEFENIPARYANELFTDYQFKSDFSHILVMAHGIKRMPVDLPVGIYRFDEETQEVSFVRPALLPWEIRDQNEFLVVDSVLPEGSTISQGATKLFKLIFPCSIAQNSYQLKPQFGKIVKIFSDLLYDNAEPNNRHEGLT